MRSKHLAGLAAAGLVVSTVAMASLRRGAPEAPPEHAAIPIRTAPVVREAYVAPIVGTGTSAADAETPLAFKTGGVVSRVLVDEGDNVAAGQLLAVVDLEEIDAHVARARSALEKATRDYDRAARLHRDSVISRDRFEDAGTARDLAAADLRAAEFNRRTAAIRAPGAGTIQRRLVEPGQTVAAGAPALILGLAGRTSVVRVGLADREAARVRVGDRAEVRFAVASETVVPGRVRRIAPVASAIDGTWQLEIGLEAPAPWADRGVVGGLVAEVTIRPSESAEAALIPIEALLEADGDSALVHLVGPGGTAERRTVRVAGLAGNRAAVTAGLEGVAAVITEGTAFLRAGTPVVAVPE